MKCHYSPSPESITFHQKTYSDNKIHGANKGPIWGRQDPGGPNVGPMNFAIWVAIATGFYDKFCAICRLFVAVCEGRII